MRHIGWPVLWLLCLVQAQGLVNTNSISITIGDSSGHNYGQFTNKVGGFDDQEFRFTVTPAVTNHTWSFKMTRHTTTGQVAYVVVSNAAITVTGGTSVVFAVSRTNIPPNRRYQAGLRATDLSGGLGVDVARGKIRVTDSLYDDDDSAFSFPAATDVTLYYLRSGDTLGGNMNAGGFAITNAGNITSTGTVTGSAYAGDGSGLTNIDWWTKAPTTAITFPTNTHTANYVIKSPDKTNWVWAADNASAGGDPIDARTATNTVNMGGFSLNHGGGVITNADSLYLGSNTTAYIPHSPLNIRGRTWDGGAITTNHLSIGYSAPYTQYAIPTIAGEDAGIVIISEYEGGHGSFIDLVNLKTNSTDFGHFVRMSLMQTNASSGNSDGQFAINVGLSNSRATDVANMPFIIQTNGHTLIGGGAQALGLNVSGVLTTSFIRALGNSSQGTNAPPRDSNLSGGDIGVEMYGQDSLLIVGSEAAGTWGSTFVLRDYDVGGSVKNNDWYLGRVTSAGGGAANNLFLGFTTNAVIPDASATANAHIYFRQIQGDIVMPRSEGLIVVGPVETRGTFTTGNGATSAGIIQISEDDDDGSNLASFSVPALAANTVYTLPPDDGDASEVLQTDGSGVMTWVAQTGGGNPIDGRAATNDVDMAGNVITNAATIAGTNFVIGTSGSLTGADTMTLAVSQLVAEVISPASGGDLTFGPSGSNVLFSANVVLNSNLNVTGTITGPGSGITAVDAATLDTLDSLAFVKADGSVAMSGAFNVGNNTITNLATPTANDHATTKAYVDAADAAPPTNTAVYGIIYIHDGSVTQTIEQTYTQVTGWTTGEVAGVTASTSNITVAADGSYLVIQSVSCQVDANNETLESAIHIESAHRNEGEWVRDMTINTVGAAPGVGVFTLSAGDVIDLRMRNTGNGTAEVLIEQAQLFVGLLSSVTAGTNWAQHAAAGNVNLGGNTITNWGATTVDNNLTVNSNLVLLNGSNGGLWDDNGSQILRYLGNVASTSLVVTLGDVSAAVNATRLEITDSSSTIRAVSAGGDVEFVVSGNLTVNSNLAFVALASGGAVTDSSGGSLIHYGGLASTTNLVLSIGDTGGGGNSTRMIISDNDKLITMKTSAAGEVKIEGDLTALVKVFTVATNKTWTAAELTGAMIFVTGTSTQTLANIAAAGHSGTFQTIGTFTTTIDPDVADFITLDGTQGTAGQAIVSPGANGDLITIISSDLTNFMTIGRSGTWTQP